VNTISAEEVVSEAESLYAQWPELPTPEKRQIVESITDKIVIGKDEIDITLSYLPSSEELTKSQRRLWPAPSSEIRGPRIHTDEHGFFSRKALSAFRVS
jgi:hypothetical protein